MYLGRRKSQSFYRASRSRFSFGFKMIIVVVALLAVLSAVITSAILGKSAAKSGLDSYGRHNLTEFGGVKQPAADYASIRNLRADYAGAVGMDKSAFKREVAATDAENAVAFKANDREGNLFFTPSLATKTPLSLNVMSTMTAEEAVKTVADSGKLSFAYFYTSALSESDVQLRVMATAREIALASELCAAGLDEIAIFDLPDESDLVVNATPYLALLESVAKRTNICVVLSKSDLDGSGVTRIINATEGYADSYAIDMSEVPNAELGKMIEKCAYFITEYNARVIVKDSADEIKNETLAILQSYGIKNYALVG